MKFEPDNRPRCMINGFTAGVLRIVWERADPYVVAGRNGMVHVARITECDTDRGMLRNEDIRNALHGLIVQDSSGMLAKIVGVEAHCTMNLYVDEQIGLLLIPVDQP